jgi:hypothetical protein
MATNKIINKVEKFELLGWDIINQYEFNDLKQNNNRDVTKLVNSIKNDGFTDPFDVWLNPDTNQGYVFDGAGRSLAIKQLIKEGYEIENLPVLFIQAKNLKEAKKYALQRSSKHGEITQSSLENFLSDSFALDEIQELAETEINIFEIEPMLDFFNSPPAPNTTPQIDPTQPINNGLSDQYSQNIGKVVYEPRTTSHTAADLFAKETKFDSEIDEIIKDPILKEMCKSRAALFSTFYFNRIADYYAYQATPEEQRIFEKLGLVLLDRDQLIENNFAELIEFAQYDPESEE